MSKKHQLPAPPPANFDKEKDPKSEKIRQLVNEGYDQDQAVAIAYSEERAGKI